MGTLERGDELPTVSVTVNGVEVPGVVEECVDWRALAEESLRKLEAEDRWRTGPCLTCHADVARGILHGLYGAAHEGEGHALDFEAPPIRRGRMRVRCACGEAWRFRIWAGEAWKREHAHLFTVQ